MRFDSIQIGAFGPFTQFRLDFGKPGADLHLIHGANEAGKSSLLRAIHDLLYGIPARSDDNFIHPYGKLRIGATVRDGEDELTFFRKKGNKGTLLDTDQNTLDESRLKAFCGSVNDEFFTHMFGLSTDGLRKGATRLLSGQGELGTLLFSASLGGSPIDAALEKLQEEADMLFAGNGRKENTIVIAQQAFKEFEKESRELSTTANAWKTLQGAIAAAEGAYQAKDDHLKEMRQRESHLKKLIQAIPLVVEFNEAAEQLADMTLPELPSDFPKRVREAQGDLSDARIRREEHAASIERKRGQLDGIAAYQSILDEAPDLDSLHQGIAGHQENLDTQIDKEEELRQQRQQLKNELNGLDLESAEALTALPDLKAGELTTIEEQAGSITTEELALEQAEANLDQAVKELEEAQGKLDNLGDVEVTPTILDLAYRITDHDKDSRMAKSQAKKENRKAADLRLLAQQLGLSDIETEKILDLAVPAHALLEELQTERDTLVDEQKASQEELDGLQKKIVDKSADIEQTSANIAVYTEENLRQAREKRDAGWTILASHLTDGTAAEADEVKALSEDIHQSDEIADALLHHAPILGKLATLNADLALLTTQRDLEASTIERLDGELEAWNERWLETSRVIEGRKFLPSELIEWRGDWQSWCETEKELSTLKKEIGDYRQTETELLKELRQHFENSEATYGVLSRQLTEAIDAAKTAKGERKVLAESIVTLTRKRSRQETKVTETTKALESSRKRWTDILSEQRLNDPGSTKAATAALKARCDARDTHQKIEGGNEILTTLVERIADFQKRLGDQRDKHLPDSPELDPKNPDLTEGRLWKLLENARKRQTKHDSLAEEIEDLETALKTKLIAIEAAEKEIEILVDEAKLESADGLSGAITQFEKRQELATKLDTTHRTLVNLAGSSPVEDLTAEASAATGHVLEVELDQLTPEIETLQHKRDEARDVLKEEVEKRTELEKAKDGAIHAKQLAAHELARVVTDSQRFIRLQHAIAFLKAQVEAYRDKSQGPMIKKTSEFFTTLTNCSFTGVAAQVDDKDSNRVNLVATRLTAEGTPDTLATTALSEGTRDQLYLALRLAAIDIHLENHSPMPLILDDILVTFDDERSESVLKVLKSLSKKTQVLIFTHHQHIAQLADTFVPEDHVQTLPVH